MKDNIVIGWLMLQLILTVCSFFWFGWQVGLLMILMKVELVKTKK